jgi:PAS domain S-box-containing protein
LEHEELAVAEEELRVQMAMMARWEEERVRERARYRELFDLLPEATLITDRRGVVREANVAALRLLATEERFVASKPLAALVEAPDIAAVHDGLAELSAERGAERTVRLRARRGSGSGVSVGLRGALMGDGSRILWTAREDVAPPAGDEAGEPARTRRALGDALAQLHRERMEASVRERSLREGLAAAQAAMASQACARSALAGELRGPVDVVVAWSRRLRSDGLTGEERESALAMVERHALAQAALVDELLDEAGRPDRSSRPHFELLDVGALVRDAAAAAPLAEQASVELSCEAPSRSMVLGDSLRLTLVVGNLLSHALRSTPVGGRVTLRCEEVERSPGGRSVRLTVEDSGRGARAGELDAIFAHLLPHGPGLRSARNPGLGLYLVRQFVELHAGSVAVETTAPDGGMRYTVTLPTTGCEGALLVAPASLGAST